MLMKLNNLPKPELRDKDKFPTEIELSKCPEGIELFYITVRVIET